MKVKASKKEIERLIGKEIKEIITSEGEKVLIRVENLYLEIFLNLEGELELDIVGPLYEL